MEEIVELLEGVKKPHIPADKHDNEAPILLDAYDEGFEDGKKTGQYELAQKLLKMLREE